VNAVPRRYRRLVALGIVSLLLHMLAIHFIGRLAGRHAAAEAPPREPLALRLQAAAPPLPVPPPQYGARPAAPKPAPRPTPPSVTQARPVLARAAAAPAPAQGGSSDAAMLDDPGRYRVAVAPSATLDYAMTRSDGTQVPVQIAWETKGASYTVAADGVTGPMSSKGGIGDTGIEPQEGRMRRQDGSEVVATFALNGIEIGARPYGKQAGIQDPASLLLHLAGMGLAGPDQLRGAVTLHVATMDGPVVMRFTVIEGEELATPLGSFTTRHLVQSVPVGQPRLEIWLAPERSWLPVQLRLTGSGGTVLTQTITRITQAGPGAGTP